jgi:hypothetical protein
MNRAIWIIRRVASFFRPTELKQMVSIWRIVGSASVHVEPSRWRRAWNACASVVREPSAVGPIWAVSMVKNEGDIIGETVRNLRAQGIDHVLVADNNSTDNTVEVLRAEGVYLVSDPIVAYWQAQKMSHLARIAVRHGASWVVPFDADELWKGENGQTVAETLRCTDANVVEAAWWNFVPLADNDSRLVAERYPWRLSRPDHQSKQAFRANWLARITIGNHTVFVPAARIVRQLRIAHYRWRSVEQMVRKASDGMQASRSAGIAYKPPQWFEVVDESVARSKLQQMIESADLVRDPSSEW